MYLPSARAFSSSAFLPTTQCRQALTPYVNFKWCLASGRSLGGKVNAAKAGLVSTLMMGRVWRLCPPPVRPLDLLGAKRLYCQCSSSPDKRLFRPGMPLGVGDLCCNLYPNGPGEGHASGVT